jgi:hypothetical protein
MCVCVCVCVCKCVCVCVRPGGAHLLQDLAGTGHVDNMVSDLPNTFWVHCLQVAQPFLGLAAQDAREHLLPQLVLLPAPNAAITRS